MSSPEIPGSVDTQIERWLIERLTPWANNPREQIALIAASMHEWGWTNPILVGADDNITAGQVLISLAVLTLAPTPRSSFG